MRGMESDGRQEWELGQRPGPTEGMGGWEDGMMDHGIRNHTMEELRSWAPRRICAVITGQARRGSASPAVMPYTRLMGTIPATKERLISAPEGD